MKKLFALLGLFTVAGCSTSGNLPQVFRDNQTNLYGYQGSSGVVIIPPEYEEAKSFNDEGLAKVYDQKKGWIVIDRFGTQVSGSSH